MRQILCDTSALVALADADDPCADLAQEYLRDIAPGIVFIVPDTIFSETMTTIKRRLDAAAAVKVGQQIRKSVRFRLYRLTEDDDRATWDIFSRYTDKEWSYVDCSLFALAQRQKIADVFSFDRHFEQMQGVTRVP
jgi:predicted nucleic acid-binding protein